jgi:uncharacterized membrane protein SpoIIM required for sporulation
VRFAIYIMGIILAVMASFRLSREVILAITEPQQWRWALP